MPLRMRTPLPSLDGVSTWVNGTLPTPEELEGHPVLVHFWSVTCYICHDVVDQVNAWRDTYGPQGLKVIAIHQPRGPEELDIEKAGSRTKSFRHTTSSTASTNCAIFRRATRGMIASRARCSGLLLARKPLPSRH
jgi:hypothetical protein